MILTLALLASSDFAPPPSRRVFVGHVTVFEAIASMPEGPETVPTTTWVPVLAAFVKHTAKGWTSKVPLWPPTPAYPSHHVGFVAPLPAAVVPLVLGSVSFRRRLLTSEIMAP